MTDSTEEIEDKNIEFARQYNETTYDEKEDPPKPYAIKLSFRLLAEGVIPFGEVLLYKYPNKRDMNLLSYLPTRIVNPSDTIIQASVSSFNASLDELSIAIGYRGL